MKNIQQPKFDIQTIKAIVGLGNPGQKYYRHRHSIGFRVLDEMAQQFGGTGWQTNVSMETATIFVIDNTGNQHKLILVKPTTYMNDSGKVFPWLAKKGIKPEEVLVIHDELELPFGKLAVRLGGSHRGHNGLRSIMGVIGKEFWRLRFGVGRPEEREDVPNYVLTNFPPDQEAQIPTMLDQAISLMTKA